jgi:hypothetical protein
VTDELTPIAVYMAHEMNTNGHGKDCLSMRQLNAESSAACIAEYFKAAWWRQLFGALTPQQCMDIEITSHQAALMMWTINVMQDSDWDHKPKIRTKFISPTTKSGAWHRYVNTEYYYDIWSNIHYGYVGVAAGFSESVLLDGAGLEQIGTDILRRRWPKRALGVEGLRAFDDESDRIAISIGMRLYQLVPKHVTAKEIVQTVLMTAGLATRSAAT